MNDELISCLSFTSAFIVYSCHLACTASEKLGFNEDEIFSQSFIRNRSAHTYRSHLGLVESSAQSGHDRLRASRFLNLFRSQRPSRHCQQSCVNRLVEGARSGSRNQV